MFGGVGNFRGRKLSRFGRNKIFTEKTFVDCSLVSLPKVPPNFAKKKTFANTYKTSKFAKVFSLESFPLYGLYLVVGSVCYIVDVEGCPLCCAPLCTYLVTQMSGHYHTVICTQVTVPSKKVRIQCLLYPQCQPCSQLLMLPACSTRSTNLSLLYSKRLKLGDESLGMRLQLPTSFKQTTPGTVFAERA